MNTIEMGLKRNSARGIIRVILLTLYVLALPVSILMAMMSPLAAIANTNNEYLLDGIILSFTLIPIALFTTILMTTLFKRKSMLWFLLPIIPVIIVMLLVRAIEINAEKFVAPPQSQFLSTSGLPVPATDVPVTLPPDPGEAGKLTLEGIDSDHDGVRDDLQREIVYQYPLNEEVRRVLTAMIKKEQDEITSVGDHEYFKALAVSYLMLSDCYNQLLSNDIDSAHNKRDILNVMLINTSQRYKTESKNSKLALPYAVEVGSTTACESVKGYY